MAREPVPGNLELIAKELLVPLHGLFHQLVQQVLPSNSHCFRNCCAMWLIVRTRVLHLQHEFGIHMVLILQVHTSLQVTTSKVEGHSQHDAILLLFCKSIDLAVSAQKQS